MPKRKRRTEEEMIADLQAEIDRLKKKAVGRNKYSSDQIRDERDRLDLSAADYGRLIGVSHLTIYNWEHGRSIPRQKQLNSWLQVKGISQGDAFKALGIKPASSGFTPEAVYEERERLELSAADYGQLVGVSPLTIYNWEKGASSPQRKQLDAWLAVKGIGKRKAWTELGY